MTCNRWLVAAALAAVMVNSHRCAAQELEPNNTFGDAQLVVGSASGSTLIVAEQTEASIDPGYFAQMVNSTLAWGEVNSHDFAGLPPGVAFFAYIDNALSDPSPDTVMRSLDEFGFDTGFDDDGSPLGNGFASGVVSTVNADGSVLIEVTGFFDYDFDGLDDEFLVPHIEEGEYDLFVQLGSFGDVDFYRLTGLTPGSAWSAETVALPGETPPDTMLSLYTDAGILADLNDDIAFPDNYLSYLEGVVPPSGEVFLSVTSFPDAGSVGAHLDFGPYGLMLSYTAIPEPSCLALAALIALGLASSRRLGKVSM